MAPVKSGPPKGVSKKPSSSDTHSRNRLSKSKGKPTPAIQQKTKSTKGSARKKQRVYTDEELGLPTLNMITPVGVQKPKGKKKGKIFVDDQESMMTILAMVNTEKEGQIESKMMKARQMEEIREAKRKEAEARKVEKRSKLEDTMDSMRRKRKHKNHQQPEVEDEIESAPSSGKSKRKRVSFA
ncbi:MAG: 60S ribosomal subunit assembly/export protein [Cirrosporium novae-zelandiae]|nr:MAG: 60S ribosomal subunit assembly/export protein [Cirrosporium novae-zelandiae]